jgi:hypothetical protein
LKGVAEEVEADDSVLGLAVGILAVDQFGLLRVEYQATRRETMSSAYRSNRTPGIARPSQTSNA